ncbi:hypothetical protein HDU98_005437, partial [Podochytrium sp. JEL0797]
MCEDSLLGDVMRIRILQLQNYLALPYCPFENPFPTKVKKGTHFLASILDMCAETGIVVRPIETYTNQGATRRFTIAGGKTSVFEAVGNHEVYNNARQQLAKHGILFLEQLMDANSEKILSKNDLWRRFKGGRDGFTELNKLCVSLNRQEPDGGRRFEQFNVNKPNEFANGQLTRVVRGPQPNEFMRATRGGQLEYGRMLRLVDRNGRALAVVDHFRALTMEDVMPANEDSTSKGKSPWKRALEEGRQFFRECDCKQRDTTGECTFESDHGRVIDWYTEPRWRLEIHALRKGSKEWRIFEEVIPETLDTESEDGSSEEDARPPTTRTTQTTNSDSSNLDPMGATEARTNWITDVCGPQNSRIPPNPTLDIDIFDANELDPTLRESTLSKPPPLALEDPELLTEFPRVNAFFSTNTESAAAAWAMGAKYDMATDDIEFVYTDGSLITGTL